MNAAMPVLENSLTGKLQIGFALAVSWDLLAAIAAKILIRKDNKNVDHHSLTSDRYLVRHQFPKPDPVDNPHALNYIS